MTNQVLYSALLGDIYEASYQPHYWPVVIEKICRLTNACSGALFMQDLTAKEGNGFYPYGLSNAFVEHYSQNYCHLDPAFMIMREQPEGVARNILTPAQHALEATDYHKNFRMQYDIGYIAGANVIVDDQQIVGVGLHRRLTARQFEDDVLQLVSDLIPHLQRALRIHREFIRLRVEKSAYNAGFDRLMIGLVLLDHLGMPVYKNPVAADILDNHPAIALRNELVTPTNQEEAAQFRRLVISCLTPFTADQPDCGGVLGLHHENRRHPLAILVRRVATSDLTNMIDGTPVYVAIYMSDPDRPSPLSTDIIAKLYGLSPTEAKIAISIVNGMTLDEIAASHSRSLNTIKTQLRAIFQKTQTTSQSELIRLLLNGALYENSTG